MRRCRSTNKHDNAKVESPLPGKIDDARVGQATGQIPLRNRQFAIEDAAYRANSPVVVMQVAGGPPKVGKGRGSSVSLATVKGAKAVADKPSPPPGQGAKAVASKCPPAKKPRAA